MGQIVPRHQQGAIVPVGRGEEDKRGTGVWEGTEIALLQGHSLPAVYCILQVYSDVSVFEYNIRFVGGLLSAYALSKNEVSWFPVHLRCCASGMTSFMGSYTLKIPRADVFEEGRRSGDQAAPSIWHVNWNTLCNYQSCNVGLPKERRGEGVGPIGSIAVHSILIWSGTVWYSLSVHGLPLLL